MKVINNGKGLTLEVSYYEAASITEAIRKGAALYEQENAPEFAEEARQIIDELMNNQVFKLGGE